MSRVEALFVRLNLNALRVEAREAGVELTGADVARHQQESRLAESALCRRFCGIGEIERDRVRVAGKSRLQTYSTWVAPEAMPAVLDQLLRCASSEVGAARMGLEARIELNLVFLESMCLKANIHFPTDWVSAKGRTRPLAGCCATPCAAR